MFTGIVKEVGIIDKIRRIGNAHRLAVVSKDIFKTVGVGSSIAVNGVCLTVVDKKQGMLSFDVVEETLRRSNLAYLRERTRVNLEDSLKAGDPLSGHFVLGHVDCVGDIVDIQKSGQDFSIKIKIPNGFGQFVVEKGSVALDGVSLTIGDVEKGRFGVYLIPHTLKVTTLGSKKVGDKINVEFDILGKYVIKAGRLEGNPNLTVMFLKEHGFGD